MDRPDRAAGGGECAAAGGVVRGDAQKEGNGSEPHHPLSAPKLLAYVLCRRFCYD